MAELENFWPRVRPKTGNELEPRRSKKKPAYSLLFALPLSQALTQMVKPFLKDNINCFRSTNLLRTFEGKQYHISLEQNLTIRSHDSGKEGHFCNCGDTSIHLPLTRSAQPSGQLSLYLLNEFNSL